MKTSFTTVSAMALSAAALSAPAYAATEKLDLSSLQHGSVVSGATIDGVTIGVENISDPTFNLAVVFDSRERGTEDRDLEGPNGLDTDDFATGNLVGTNVGNLIIIQENSGGSVVNGVHTSPDDEGSRPAGNLFFDFATPITSFGFDLIDVEETETFIKGSGFFATLLSGDQQFQVNFNELPSLDPTVEFGNNSANRIDPIEASDFGVVSFDSVTINFGGSAGVANINYTTVVPSPSAVGGGIALMLTALTRRRKKLAD
ncbi:MAG: hypothetical protein AAGH99_04645 [Planctomycetota bacterium]